MLWSEFYPWFKVIFLFSYSLSYSYTRKQRKLKFEPNMHTLAGFRKTNSGRNNTAGHVVELYRLKTVTILFTFAIDCTEEH